LKSLLPILDDFDRALKMMPAEDPNVAGIVLIHAKLTETLKSQGLKSMEPTQGQSFDPEYMEAITTLVVPQPELAGTVIDELERGYLVGEKIIRYAKVVVGKAPDA
jgi:molecular chaperone GrpE